MLKSELRSAVEARVELGEEMEPAIMLGSMAISIPLLAIAAIFCCAWSHSLPEGHPPGR
jgi:hypothetical protein